MEDNINTKNKEERDWEKTGIKVLDMAKQELFLGMRYMFLALNMLGKRGADPDKLMAKLYRFTTLEDSFSCNFNVLIGGASSSFQSKRCVFL